MPMSRFEQNEAETAAFVTKNFLDLKEFDCLGKEERASVEVFIRETIFSQLSCCRRGLWEQLQAWIPAPLRRTAQRHVRPVVPGESPPGYHLPESVQHEYDALNELAWLLGWKHRRMTADLSLEERHSFEKLDLERVQHIKETILPLLAEKISRLEKSVTEADQER